MSGAAVLWSNSSNNRTRSLWAENVAFSRLFRLFKRSFLAIFLTGILSLRIIVCHECHHGIHAVLRQLPLIPFHGALQLSHHIILGGFYGCAAVDGVCHNRRVCSVSLLTLLLRRFSCSDFLPACRIGEGIKLDLKEQVWLGRKLCAQKLRNHRSHPTFSLHFPWQSNNGITGFIQKKSAFYMTESQVSSSTHGNEITAFAPTQ